MEKAKKQIFFALGLDFVIAGIVLIASMIFFFGRQPTAAESGYGILSQEVASQQYQLVIMTASIWLLISILESIFFKKTIGQFLVGVYYPKEISFIKRTLSIILAPIPFINRILKIELYKKQVNFFYTFFRIVGTLVTIISYPIFLIALLIMCAIFFIPRKYSNLNDVGLCGEKYCIVKPNLNCKKNLDFIKTRTVEVLGEEYSGTGIILTPSLILTNYHVVENQNNIIIRQANNNNTDATLYRFNEDLDLALLIGQFFPGEHIQFVDPRNFTEGTDLYALGFPGTLLIEPGTAKSLTVTKGIYSTFIDLPEFNLHLVQTDTPLNPGNSGGPIVTECGQVVGIATLIDRIDPLTKLAKEGINFAISSTTIVPELNKLLK